MQPSRGSSATAWGRQGSASPSRCAAGPWPPLPLAALINALPHRSADAEALGAAARCCPPTSAPTAKAYAATTTAQPPLLSRPDANGSGKNLGPRKIMLGAGSILMAMTRTIQVDQRPLDPVDEADAPEVVLFDPEETPMPESAKPYAKCEQGGAVMLEWGGTTSRRAPS